MKLVIYMFGFTECDLKSIFIIKLCQKLPPWDIQVKNYMKELGQKFFINIKKSKDDSGFDLKVFSSDKVQQLKFMIEDCIIT